MTGNAIQIIALGICDHQQQLHLHTGLDSASPATPYRCNVFET